MSHNTALEAMKLGVCLELQYDGYSRLVEVHAVGLSPKENICMRVYQVGGGSVSNEPIGWKMMAIEKAFTMHLSEVPSTAPRDGYRPGDRGMIEIYGEL